MQIVRIAIGLLPGIEVLDGRELGPVHTICCNALWSDAKQLLNEEMMQPVKILSVVQR